MSNSHPAIGTHNFIRYCNSTFQGICYRTINNKIKSDHLSLQTSIDAWPAGQHVSHQAQPIKVKENSYEIFMQTSKYYRILLNLVCPICQLFLHSIISHMMLHACFIKVHNGLTSNWKNVRYCLGICKPGGTEEKLEGTVVEKEHISWGWTPGCVMSTGYHKIITLISVIQLTVALSDLRK